MLRLIRFLLYCFAVFIGAAGLLDGGIPLLKYTVERLTGHSYEAYMELSVYDRFSSEIILILSLMLLILVHIGHVFAGGLRFPKSGQPDPLGMLPGGPRRLTPEELNRGSAAPKPAQTAAEIASTNEKLAHLVKNPPVVDHKAGE